MNAHASFATSLKQIHAHRAPTPEPVEDPLPGEHPVPQEEPVPSPNPQSRRFATCCMHIDG